MKRAQRGFTLLELMVGATISIVVIGAVTAAFLAQNRAFVSLDLNRVAADASRDSFLEMEPSLRRAGFGLDPRYAFDFAYYACPAANCRDSITGPDCRVPSGNITSGSPPASTCSHWRIASRSGVPRWTGKPPRLSKNQADHRYLHIASLPM